MRNCSLRVGFALVLLGLFTSAFAAKKGKEISWVETEVQVIKLQHTVKYEFNRLVAPGRVIKVRNGQDGEIRKEPFGKDPVEVELQVALLIQTVTVPQ